MEEEELPPRLEKVLRFVQVEVAVSCICGWAAASSALLSTSISVAVNGGPTGFVLPTSSPGMPWVAVMPVSNGKPG